MRSLGWAAATGKLGHGLLGRLKLDIEKNMRTSFRKIPAVLNVLWLALEGSAAYAARALPAADSPKLAEWKAEGSDPMTRPQDRNVPTFGCGATHADFASYFDFELKQARHVFCSGTVLACCLPVFLFLYEVLLFRNSFFRCKTVVPLFAGQVRLAELRQPDAVAVRDAGQHDVHQVRLPDRAVVPGAARAEGPAGPGAAVALHAPGVCPSLFVGLETARFCVRLLFFETSVAVAGVVARGGRGA